MGERPQFPPHLSDAAGARRTPIGTRRARKSQATHLLRRRIPAACERSQSLQPSRRHVPALPQRLALARRCGLARATRVKVAATQRRRWSCVCGLRSKTSDGVASRLTRAFVHAARGWALKYSVSMPRSISRMSTSRPATSQRSLLTLLMRVTVIQPVHSLLPRPVPSAETNGLMPA